MKITNIESGKPYQLDPDTELSVERTNPFFHDYGEQTLPVALPDSEYNRMVLGHPEIIQRKDKVKLVEASIQDGEYFSICRQAILSVTRNKSIDTSFYMNDGSFYSRLEDTLISEIFGEETVPGISTVDEALNWMTQLWLSGGNDQFACFAVEISGEKNSSIYLNHFNIGEQAFYHSVERVEKLEDRKIIIPKGFYITPFIKALYVLKRLFSYYGYTLTDSFLSKDTQLSNLVFINNVADAIVTGNIRVAQLLPKVSCKTILDLFRKKFCCEFVTNEAEHTVNIILMNDVIHSLEPKDLSPYLVEIQKIIYPEEYQRISLKSKSSVSKNSSSLESTEAIKLQNPTVRFSPELGVFYRDGFSYKGYVTPTRQIICDTDQMYSEGGDIVEHEIEIPECIPSYSEHEVPYIGEVQWLNSSLRSGTPKENQEIMEEKESKDSMELMLAFVCRVKEVTMGTVTNYAIYRRSILDDPEYIRIGDYSLVYNGDEGIFEKFYREYDILLRNTLHTVEVSLLLPQKIKRSLKSIQKVLVHNAEYLISSLKFTLGRKELLSEATLLTLGLYNPISFPKKITEIIPEPNTGYHWVGYNDNLQITKEEYENSPFRDSEIPNVYPLPATKEDVGKKLYERKTVFPMEVEGKPSATTWWLISYWLEAVKDV